MAAGRAALVSGVAAPGSGSHAGLEVGGDVGPLGVEDRVDGGAPPASVGQELPIAKDSVEAGGQGLEGAAGAPVLLVGLELDALAAEDVEGVAQLQQLGLGVGAGAQAEGVSQVQPISRPRWSGRRVQ
jgi:hypothetical protein